MVFGKMVFGLLEKIYFLGMASQLELCYRPVPSLISGSTVAARSRLDTSVIFHFEEEVAGF